MCIFGEYYLAEGELSSGAFCSVCTQQSLDKHCMSIRVASEWTGCPVFLAGLFYPLPRVCATLLGHLLPAVMSKVALFCSQELLVRQALIQGHK